MADFYEIAKKATVTKGDMTAPKMKGQKQLWMFDFSSQNIGIAQMGEHADTLEEATELIAKRLDSMKDRIIPIE